MIVSDRGKLALYLLLLTAHIAFVWLLPYFPSQDGPSHLNNLYILKDLLQGGQIWGKYYIANLNPSPNLGFTLIAYPLAYFFSPLVTEKIFLTIYISLMGVSAPILLRTFDRPAFPLSFLVLPALFNHSLLMGFYSYTISVPLFILSFSLAWTVRDHPTSIRFICLNLTGLLLYYFHLISFVFFLISLVAIALSRSQAIKQSIRNLVILSIIISPLLFTLSMYFIVKPKRGLPDSGFVLSFHRALDLANELLAFSTINLSPWQKAPAFLFMFLIIFMLYEAMKEIYRSRRINIGMQESDRVLIFLLAVLTSIYLLAPFRFGEGSHFNERFPWVILLLLLPLLRFPVPTILRYSSWIFIILTVSMYFVVNSIYLWRENLNVATFTRGLQADIPQGSFVMTYRTTNQDWPRMDMLLHTSAYYGMFKKCVDIGNYEVYLDYFQVRLNSKFPEVPTIGQIEIKPTTIRWQNYSSINYLLAWDVNKREKEELSLWFSLVLKEGPLTVWQNKMVGSSNSLP